MDLALSFECTALIEFPHDRLLQEPVIPSGPFQRVHSSSTSLDFGCEKCGRRFKWASSLGCHVRAAHSAPSVAWEDDGHACLHFLPLCSLDSIIIHKTMKLAQKTIKIADCSVTQAIIDIKPAVPFAERNSGTPPTVEPTNRATRYGLGDDTAAVQ